MDEAPHADAVVPAGSVVQPPDAAASLALYAKLASKSLSASGNTRPAKSRKTRQLSAAAGDASPAGRRWNAAENITAIGRKLVKVLFPVVKNITKLNKLTTDEIYPTFTAAEITAKYLTIDVSNAAVVLLALVEDPECKLPDKFTSIGRLCGRLLIEVAQEFCRCRVDVTGSEDVENIEVNGLFKLYQVCQAFYNRFMRTENRLADDISGYTSDSDSEVDARVKINAVHGCPVAFDFIPPMLVYLMRFSVPKFTDAECRTLDPLLRFVEHAKFFLRKTVDAEKKSSTQSSDGNESDDSSLFDDLEHNASQKSVANGDNYLNAFDRDVVQAVIASIRIFVLRIVLFVDDKHLDKGITRLARIMTANDEICDYCHATIKLALCQPMPKAQEARATRAFGLIYKASWTTMQKRVSEADVGLVAILHMVDNANLEETVQHVEQNIVEIIAMSVKLSDGTNMLQRVQSVVRTWREVCGSRTNLDWRRWVFEKFRQHLEGQDASPDERVRRNLLWLMAVFFPFVDPSWTRKKQDNEAEGQLKLIRDLLFDSAADVRFDAVNACMAILQHSWQSCSTAAARGIVNDVVQLCFDQHNLKVKLRAIDFFIELVQKHETHMALKKALVNLKPLIYDTNLTVIQKVLKLYEQIVLTEQQYKDTIASQEAEQNLVRLRDACDLPVLMSMFNSKSLINFGKKQQRRRVNNNNDCSSDDITEDNARIAESILADVAVILRKYVIPKPPTGIAIFDADQHCNESKEIKQHKSRLRRCCFQLKGMDRSYVLKFYEMFAKLASDAELLARYPPELFAAETGSDDAVHPAAAQNGNGDNMETGTSDDNENVDAEDDESAAQPIARRGRGRKKSTSAKGKAKKKAALVPLVRVVSQKNLKSRRGRKPKKASRNQNPGDEPEEEQQIEAENVKLRAPRDELLLLITSLLSGLKYFQNALIEINEAAAADENFASDNFEQRLNDKISELLDNDENTENNAPIEGDAPATAVAVDRREYAKSMNEALYLIQVAGTMFEAGVFVALHKQLSAGGQQERLIIMQKMIECAKIMLSCTPLWRNSTGVDESSNLSMHMNFLPHALILPLLLPRVAASERLPQQIDLTFEHLHNQMLYKRRHVAQLMCRVLWRTEKYRPEVVNFLFDCICTDGRSDNDNSGDSGVGGSDSPGKKKQTRASRTLTNDDSSRRTTRSSRSNSAAHSSTERSHASVSPRAGGRRGGIAATASSPPPPVAAQQNFRLPSSISDADRCAEAPLVGLQVLHALLAYDMNDRSNFFEHLGQQRLRQLHDQVLKRLKAAVVGRSNEADVGDDIVGLVASRKRISGAASTSKRKSNKNRNLVNDDDGSSPFDDDKIVFTHVQQLADTLGAYTEVCLGSVDLDVDFDLEHVECELVAGCGWPELMDALAGTSNSNSPRQSGAASSSSSSFRQTFIESLKDLSIPIMGSGVAVPMLSGRDHRKVVTSSEVVDKVETAATPAALAKRSTRTTRNSNNDNGDAIAQIVEKSAEPAVRGGKKRRRGAAKNVTFNNTDTVAVAVPQEGCLNEDDDENAKISVKQEDTSDLYEEQLRVRVAATIIKRMCEMADRISENREFSCFTYYKQLNAGFFNGFSTLLYLFEDLDLYSSTILHNAVPLTSTVANMMHQAVTLLSVVEGHRAKHKRNSAAESEAEDDAIRPPPSPTDSFSESMLYNAEGKIGPLVQHAAKMLARLLLAKQFNDFRWMQYSQHDHKLADAERKRFAAVCMQAQKPVDKLFKNWCNAWPHGEDEDSGENENTYRLLVLQEFATLLIAPSHARLLRQAVLADDDIAKRVVSFFARYAVDWPQDKQIVMKIVGKVGSVMTNMADAAEVNAVDAEAGGDANVADPNRVKENVRFKWIKQFSTCMIFFVKLSAAPETERN